MKAVGKITSAHGIRGEIFVYIYSKDPFWLSKLKQFQLSLNPNTIYEVKKSRLHKNGVIIESPQIKTRNEAEAIRGCEFLIDPNLLKSVPGEYLVLSDLIGFQVYDFDQLIGEVVAAQSLPGQDLLQVKMQNGHVADIPLNDDLIADLQMDEKKIFMELPEGLLEINYE